MTTENNEYINLAKKTALEAGGLLRKIHMEPLAVNSQTATDIKLQADLDSEAMIREALGTTGLPIIGEEGGGDAALLDSDELFWVVDPLDGTYNFFRHQPFACVSIGLMRGSDFVGGVVYDFTQDVLYANGSEGITVNGKLHLPNWAGDITEACLMTGFPSTTDFSRPSLQSFVTSFQKFKKVRMIGSAAMALVFVATGMADCYYERVTRIWDVAAGLSLVKQAGGHVRIEALEGRPFQYNVWAAAKRDWIE